MSAPVTHLRGQYEGDLRCRPLLDRRWLRLSDASNRMRQRMRQWPLRWESMSGSRLRPTARTFLRRRKYPPDLQRDWGLLERGLRIPWKPGCLPMSRRCMRRQSLRRSQLQPAPASLLRGELRGDVCGDRHLRRDDRIVRLRIDEHPVHRRLSRRKVPGRCVRRCDLRPTSVADLPQRDDRTGLRLARLLHRRQLYLQRDFGDLRMRSTMQPRRVRDSAGAVQLEQLCGLLQWNDLRPDGVRDESRVRRIR
jgi:hypothetical protein